jgi:phosphatidylethanolamine-binding protein (PEBP) family uncharacterized protein
MNNQPRITSTLCQPSFLRLLMPVLLSVLTHSACTKENNRNDGTSGFSLSSPVIGPDSLLPRAYTCDGESSTLPLIWSGYPEGTSCFALIMHHEASPTDIHWYWVIYDIPVSVNHLDQNMTDIGKPGNNSVNGQTAYAPPCSQGPGLKLYILTLYALSETPKITVPDSAVSRDVLLEAIKNITLESTSLTVAYAREF